MDEHRHICAIEYCTTSGTIKIKGEVRLPGVNKPVEVETWVCSSHGKKVFGDPGPFSINRGQ